MAISKETSSIIDQVVSLGIPEEEIEQAVGNLEIPEGKIKEFFWWNIKVNLVRSELPYFENLSHSLKNEILQNTIRSVKNEKFTKELKVKSKEAKQEIQRILLHFNWDLNADLLGLRLPLNPKKEEESNNLEEIILWPAKDTGLLYRFHYKWEGRRIKEKSNQGQASNLEYIIYADFLKKTSKLFF